MRRIILILVLVILYTSCSKPSALDYTIIVPKNVESQQLPLLVFLHGWGGTKNQFIPFVKSDFDDMLVVFAQAPFKEGEKGNSWSRMVLGKREYKENLRQAEYSRIQINNLLSKLIKENNIDTQRIFICGMSQGAMMTLRVGLNPPYLAKGLICINGRLPAKMLIDSLPDEVKSKLNLFLINGIQDTIIPIASARKMVKELNRMGLKLTTQESNMGHPLDRKLILAFKPWLLKELNQKN